MSGYFNKLRKKPKHVRDNIAFSIAGGFTLVVAIAWFMVGFEMPRTPQVAQEESNGAFSTLLSQIQEQVATAREGFESATTTNPADGGEWGYAAQNATTTTDVRIQQQLQKEAAIMIVNSSSTRGATSTTATSSVLY